MSPALTFTLRPLRTQIANQHVIPNVNNVTLTALPQSLATLIDSPKLGVGRDPRVRHTLAFIYLIEKYLPGFLVLHFLGNAYLLTSLRVVGPLLRKE